MQPIASDGYIAVPAGKVATIVTSLEMTAPPAADTRRRAPADVSLSRLERPDLDRYRRLFRAVGEDWLWFSRLRMSDAELSHVIHDPDVAVHVLTRADHDIGMLELDFRNPAACEIAFFGVTRDVIGHGLGGYLMAEAVARAWARPIARLWVHTCTLDHPAALQFYRRCGFRAFKQEVEIADDPRVRGELPRTAGAHVPIYD